MILLWIFFSLHFVYSAIPIAMECAYVALWSELWVLFWHKKHWNVSSFVQTLLLAKTKSVMPIPRWARRQPKNALDATLLPWGESESGCQLFAQLRLQSHSRCTCSYSVYILNSTCTSRLLHWYLASLDGTHAHRWLTLHANTQYSCKIKHVLSFMDADSNQSLSIFSLCFLSILLSSLVFLLSFSH